MPESPGTAERQQPEIEGCPMAMAMSVGERCGQPLYNALAGVDEEPVCLMHSRDPNKDKQAFQQEIERILEVAGNGLADFSGYVFPEAQYRGRKFKAKCLFWKVIFTQGALFTSSNFSQEVNFTGAIFIQAADFMGVTFAQEAIFAEATFTRGAFFFGATFTREVYFTAARFPEFADFRAATFLSGAWYKETKFRKDVEQIGAVFDSARFEKPEKVRFYKTHLEQALFHNCDVSRVDFSNVEWRRRPGNQKRMLFEEVVSLENATARDLKPPEGSADERNYALIAETYQQLKKNYDDRRDYWTAGDFHYGEMEMKRLSSGYRNWVLRWLHRKLGLAAWYKYASEYGESYVRPAVWLGIVLLVFSLLYPVAGLDPNGRNPASEISYRNFSEFLSSHPKGAWWGTAAFFGHSLMTAVSVMAFQREFEYAPAYPWGWLLRLLQLLLSSTLIALFLLAVRRQFRR
ncbi:MAG: pentapeptide repeat-containing protein [Acidobacteria bacterium]|nr:pentapeptide repeat-containing protein [Acidobacteriota bacterium]